MSKQNYLSISEGINEVKQMKYDMVNSKAKRNFEKTTNKIKQVYDKLYHYAFFDYRFHTCNYNKLLEDIKNYSSKLNTKLIFLKVPGMVQSMYSVSNRKNMVMKFIDDLKRYIKMNQEKFLFKNVYTIDDFIILATKKEYTDSVYYEIKKNKKTYNLQIGAYYVKYENLSSKVNKNIDMCIAQAVKVTGGKNNEREYDEDDDI